MEQTQQKIDILLLTYNGESYLADCLASIFSQSHRNFSLWVIDNSSTDQTLQVVHRFQKKQPDIKLTVNQQNLGYSCAYNKIIGQTQSEFILCLNQDVKLDKDFLKYTVQAFSFDSRIAAVQGKLLRLHKPSLIDTVGLQMLKNRRIIAKGQGQEDCGQYDKMEYIFGADGAAPVYRRYALEDVRIKDEYFDEDFFMYKEDVDLAWRLRLYGWQAILQPKAVAWHSRSAGDSAAVNYWGIIRERRKISNFAKYLAFKNQRLMQIKNEQWILLARHSFWFLPKEIASWLYVLLFERYTWRAVRDLVRQLPAAWQKRKIIQKNKKLTAGQMVKYFK